MPADRHRITDTAARPTLPDDYVWHLVMHRAGRPPRTGERLVSVVLAPADVAGYGLAELVARGVHDAGPRRQLRTGLDVLGRALEAERRVWVRRIARAGYVDGWGVGIVADRGRRRTLFAGMPELARARVITP